MKNILLLCLFLSFGSASAALNKWVDAQGNVHYSDDKPPPNVKSKTLRSSSVSKHEGANKAEGDTSIEHSDNAFKSLAERQADRKRAKLAEQEAAKIAAKEQANKEHFIDYCKSARENLKALKDGIRLAVVDESGERTFMNDNQRQKNITNIQKNIKKHCI